MLDYGTLPPEINSERMHSGPGSGPMLAAAMAWEVLATGLDSISRNFATVIATLQGENWSGGASDAMVSAAAPYVAWVATASAQAEETAIQARAAASAYEAAFAATVPPAAVAANRTQLAALIATNTFGQNTVMIAAAEAQYEQMWAQDAAAMYGYAAASSAAAGLRQFTEPPQTTKSDGRSAQAAAVAQATGASTADNAQTSLSQLMSSATQQLQLLASTKPPSGGGSSPIQLIMKMFSSFNTLSGPVGLASNLSRSTTSAMSGYTGVYRSAIQAGQAAAKAAAGAAKAASVAGVPADLPHPVLASAGSAPTIGKMSVPQSWAANSPVAAPVEETMWLSEAELGDGPSWSPALLSGGQGAGMRSTSGLRPTVSNALRLGPPKFKMPRPSLGG